MTFEDISLMFIIQRKHFCKYLQLRSFISSSQNQSLTIPTLTPLEEITFKNCRSNGLISLLYNWLVSGSGESAISKLDAWGLDLQVDISNNKWNKVCKEAQTKTASTYLNFLQDNWLMRTYITTVNLHK